MFNKIGNRGAVEHAGAVEAGRLLKIERGWERPLYGDEAEGALQPSAKAAAT